MLIDQCHKFTNKIIEFWYIYPLSVLFVFHISLVAYINSSYMEQFMSTEGVSILFTVSSAVSVLTFLFFSHALKAAGNVKLTLILAVIDLLCLIILGLNPERAIAITAFFIFLVTSPLLYLNIDIFSEALIGHDEESTGNKRGLILGFISLTGVLATVLVGLIMDGHTNFSAVYYTAAGTLVLFIVFLLTTFSDFTDPDYDIFQIRTSLRTIWLKPNIRNVMFSHFLLQVFFIWTVIYFPLYLFTEMGFAWDKISYILAFGLLAYVLLEWPIGIIADRWFGEKEIMTLGFLILTISVTSISFITSTSILAWMLIMFATRVGAACVEATTEIYFFKHSDGDDADTISFFRLLRPLAAVGGTLLGSVALLYLPFQMIFVVLGFFLIPGLFFSFNIEDTK